MGKLIFAGVGFVLAGMLFFMYTQPTYANIGVIQAQITEYEGALQKAAQLEQLKQTLLNKYNSFNPDDLGRLQTLLPSNPNNIGLILELDSLASKYGLALENVNVTSSDSTASSPAPTSPAQISGAVGASNSYDTITLNFSTYGTYANFISFLHDLESSLRVVDLVSLSIKPNSGSGQAGTYNYDMSINTYWLK